MSAYLTLSDLTKPQQLALLTLLGGELGNAAADALRLQGAGPMASLDFIALQQAGLAIRLRQHNKLVLTPIGRHRAGDLARSIAKDAGLHVFTFGRAQGATFVRCTCGQFATGKATAIPGAHGKIVGAAADHLRFVEGKIRGSMLLLQPIAQ